jgi:hypothetical protein
MITVGEGRDIEITAYREEYAGDFARLNLEWLEDYALIEELDRKYLEDPLVSSTKLAAAVQLYESLGFQHAQMPADVGYQTADVYMELELE